MPEAKRYQVFISSTSFDLAEERHAVTMALLELDAFPAAMELFPATDGGAWSLIERIIGECDYYLLVVGGRYGSLEPASGVSYTEREYDHAMTLGKPVLAFLHGEPESLPFGEASPGAREQLKRFRARVEQTHLVRYWNGAEDLAGKVSRTFIQQVRSSPATGWVRADALASRETLAELNDLRKELNETRRRLDEVTAALDATQRDRVTLRLDARWRLATYSAEQHDNVSVEVTWPSLFGLVAPTLLEPTVAWTIDRALTAALLGSLSPGAQRALRAPTDKYSISEGQRELVLRRFMAQGLIVETKVANEAAWRLTDGGWAWFSADTRE